MTYIIVGAEVSNESFHLDSENQIQSAPSPGSTPLNVEYIGQLMVKLSEAGPENVSPEEKKAHEETIRHALKVEKLSTAGGATGLSAEDEALLKAIHDKIKVNIVFEERIKTAGQTDVNTRILVVPADGTLGAKEKQLQAEPNEPGFRPPLSYELDRMLRLAHEKDLVIEAIRSFAAKSVEGWSSELQTALEAHIESELAQKTTFAGDAGAKSAILEQPVRAFHRSVGIYATNMCR